MIKLNTNKIRVRCLECKIENYIVIDDINSDRAQRSLDYEYEHTCNGKTKCKKCGNKLIIEIVVYEYPKDSINYIEPFGEGCIIPDDVATHDNNILYLDNTSDIDKENSIELEYKNPDPYEEFLTTSWTKFIHKMFEHSFSKEWYETYWVIDMHRTLIEATYDLNDKSLHYYPFALETMQMLTERDDIITIMWTSSYPQEIVEYVRELSDVGIIFNEINENPDISSNNGNFGYYEKKFYFNVLIDDKAAFDPKTDWEPIYNLFKEYQKNNFLPDPAWTTKY